MRAFLFQKKSSCACTSLFAQPVSVLTRKFICLTRCIKALLATRAALICLRTPTALPLPIFIRRVFRRKQNIQCNKPSTPRLKSDVCKGFTLMKTSAGDFFFARFVALGFGKPLLSSLVCAHLVCALFLWGASNATLVCFAQTRSAAETFALSDGTLVALSFPKGSFAVPDAVLRAWIVAFRFGIFA